MSSSDLRGPNIRFSPFVAGSGRDFELCFQIVERRLDMLGQQMLDGIAIARHPRVEQLPVFEVRPRFAARRLQMRDHITFRQDRKPLDHLGREQPAADADERGMEIAIRSEEHTSELQSLMRITYAVFCCKKKK